MTLAAGNADALTALATKLSEVDGVTSPVATVPLRPESPDAAEGDGRRGRLGARPALDGLLTASGVNQVGRITDQPVEDFEPGDGRQRARLVAGLPGRGRQVLAQGGGRQRRPGSPPPAAGSATRPDTATY